MNTSIKKACFALILSTSVLASSQALAAGGVSTEATPAEAEQEGIRIARAVDEAIPTQDKYSYACFRLERKTRNQMNNAEILRFNNSGILFFAVSSNKIDALKGKTPFFLGDCPSRAAAKKGIDIAVAAMLAHACNAGGIGTGFPAGDE